MVIPKGYIITDKCCDKTRFYDTLADFPPTGLVSRLYVDRSTGIIYVWDGTEYIPSGGPAPVFAANVAAFPVTGAEETLYIDESIGAIYIWDGAEYITADVPTVLEARICLNTATPSFSPLDPNNPTTAEVETYVSTNGISTDGTQVVYFVDGTCDEPDFIWTLNGVEITLSYKPITFTAENFNVVIRPLYINV